MLIILGLTCISTLSGHGKRGLLLGLMSGAFGFMISLVGQDRHAGILRFTFGQLYLWNGLSIIPVMVGLFAIRKSWISPFEGPPLQATSSLVNSEKVSERESRTPSVTSG